MYNVLGKQRKNTLNLKEYQKIADKVFNYFNVHPKSLKIRISDVKGGWASGDGAGNDRITLPKWLEEKDKNYAIYYCIHEVSHVVAHLKGSRKAHDAFFKKIQGEALALWGIRTINKSSCLYVNGYKIYTKLGPNQT